MRVARLALATVSALALTGMSFGPTQGRLVHIRVDVQGLPKESAGGPLVSSRTTAAGTISVRRPLETSSYLEQRVAPRGQLIVAHADTLSGQQRHELRLRALGLRLTSFADGTRVLSFTALVVTSNDPACPIGRRGPMFLVDGPGSADSVRMVVCPYDHEHYFEAGVRARVVVRIG